MQAISDHPTPALGRFATRFTAVCAGLLFLALSAQGQTWTWKTETVAKSGRNPSLAVDASKNVHLSYVGTEGIMYGFRPADSGKWFTMPISAHAEDAFTAITVDSRGNPRICFTAYESLRYANFQDDRWVVNDVGSDLGVIEFTCSLAVGTDGTPHLLWYQYMDRDRSLFLHLKYADLRDGAWQARTLDFDGETGKWNSMVLDSKGNPHIAYTAWTNGDFKYAYWDGKGWTISVVDSRGLSDPHGGRGMGNSLALTPSGIALLSYLQNQDVILARQQKDGWVRERIDSLSAMAATGWAGSHTSLMLDTKGDPHIVYGDFGSLKHAYRIGNRWKIQVVQLSNGGQFKHTAAVIDGNDTIYIAYRDPADDSLKVTVGTLAPTPKATEIAAKNHAR